LQGGLFLFIALWLLFPEHSERWLEYHNFIRTLDEYSSAELL